MHKATANFAATLRSLGTDRVPAHRSRFGRLWDASELPLALRGPRILMGALALGMLASFPAVALSPYLFSLMYFGGGLAIMVAFFSTVKRGTAIRVPVDQGLVHRALWTHAGTLPRMACLRRRWELGRLLNRVVDNNDDDDRLAAAKRYSVLLSEVRPTLELPPVSDALPSATLVEKGNILIAQGDRTMGLHQEYSESFKIVSPCCFREPRQSLRGWLCPCGLVVAGYVRPSKKRSWDDIDLDAAMKIIIAYLGVNPLTATILRGDVDRLTTTAEEEADAAIDDIYDDLMSF